MMTLLVDRQIVQLYCVEEVKSTNERKRTLYKSFAANTAFNKHIMSLNGPFVVAGNAHFHTCYILHKIYCRRVSNSNVYRFQ